MMNELSSLRAVLPKLAGRDREFAESLLKQAGGRGLTEKQKPWLQRLIERATNPEPDRKQQIGPEFGGVVALLDKAAARLKWPRLLFRAGGEDYRLTLAGEMSRSPGTINVTDLGKGEDRTWYGRVTREGAFEPSARLDAKTLTAITAALKAVSADPAGVAKAYGLETGACCFCGLELTDKRSIAAGYGTVCADKWGMPWGM